MQHIFNMRIYYEDTDLSGMVYYANYLKFIERARSEWIRDLGINQKELRATEGIVFAVRTLEADYIKAAQFDDLLKIITTVEYKTAARLVLKQTVYCHDKIMFTARITLVALTSKGKPTRLPAEIRHQNS